MIQSGTASSIHILYDVNNIILYSYNISFQWNNQNDSIAAVKYTKCSTTVCGIYDSATAVIEMKQLYSTIIILI